MHQVRLILPAGSRLPFHPREIRGLVLRMLPRLTPKAAEVELVFVRDAEITSLNRQFLGCPGPTNCLAFPDAESSDVSLRGILFISLDCLYRECLLYEQAPATHLLRLLAHGLAHLGGFDHGKEMERVCAILERCREQD